MYSTLDVAYNDNTADLDKMARELNNKKNNLFKSVYDDFEKKQRQWENDITEYNNLYPKSDGSKSYSSKSYSSKSDSSESNELNSKDSNNSYTNPINSFESISIDSPSLDSYIDIIKEKKDNKKPIHDFLRTLSHNEKKSNEEDIFSHIKYCFECREKLLKYMRNHDEKLDKNIKNNESMFNYFDTIQTKEIFLIIILGIILIIFLDFLMKTPYLIQ